MDLIGHYHRVLLLEESHSLEAPRRGNIDKGGLTITKTATTEMIGHFLQLSECVHSPLVCWQE